MVTKPIKILEVKNKLITGKEKILIFVIVGLLAFAVAAPFHVINVRGPSQVSNLTVQRIDEGAHLNWERVENADYYLVYKNGEQISSTRQTFYSDKNITSDENYLYKVSAVSDGLIGHFVTKKLEAVKKESEKPENAVEIVSTLSYIKSNMNPAIVGEIKNKKNIVIEHIEIKGSFYLGNTFIGSEKTHYQYHEDFGFKYVSQNEKVPFRAFIVLSHNEVIRKIAKNLDQEIRFNVEIINYSVANQSIYMDLDYEGENSSVATLKPYKGYNISYGGKFNQEDGEYIVNVKLKNNGGKEVKETIVCAAFYNKTLGIVGFEKTTILDGPSPGENKNINLTFTEGYYKIEGEEKHEATPFAEIVDSYKVYVRGTPQNIS